MHLAISRILKLWTPCSCRIQKKHLQEDLCNVLCVLDVVVDNQNVSFLDDVGPKFCFCLLTRTVDYRVVPSAYCTLLDALFIAYGLICLHMS